MYAFVHIAKTAGTTLTSILRRSFGIRHFDDRILQRPMVARDLRQLKKVMPHVTSLAGHGIQPHLDLHTAETDLRYYTFLREPIQRAISCFQFVVATHPDYRDHPFTDRHLRDWFLAHIERDNNCQTWHLAGSNDAEAAIEILVDRVGFVGLVDRFDESLLMLRAWMHEPLDIRYQALNVSAKRGSCGRKSKKTDSDRMQTLRKFCRNLRADGELLEYLQAHNAADQRLYRYVHEHMYTQQRQFLLGRRQPGEAAIRQPEVGRSFGWESQLRMLPCKVQRNLVLKPLKRWLFDAA